jgi:hypothetical protein
MFSFLQFSELDTITACNWTDTEMCLPVFAVNDVWFQFTITASTEEEADALCTQGASPVTVGHVQECSDALTPFTGTITRYRISATKVLYYWSHGITTLNTLEVGECFRIGVEVFDQFFCSNCFQRIGSDCHTNVVEYYNEQDNAFGFVYCAGEAAGGDDPQGTCEPLILEFSNQATMTINWTAYLENLYGTAPDVTVWTYQGSELINAGQVVKYDTYPFLTELRIDLGGPQSGVIRIS